TLAQHLHLEQQDHWQTLREELFEAGVVIHEANDLTPSQIEYLQRLFRDEIFPVLTPIAVDPAHPFPFIPNLGYSLAFELVRPGTSSTLSALVRVPGNLDRFITLPSELSEQGRIEVVTVDTTINLFFHKMFPGYEVSGSGAFRVIRDSEIEIDDEAADLVSEFETALRQRRRGQVIRLEIDKNMPRAIQWITTVIPLRYFLVIVRGIFLKGVGLEVLWPQLAALGAWGVVVLALAAMRSRRLA
ncbi:MAG: hypothetical protein J0I48_22535, partial [Devosia sp.]|nr:hypothetical protein [Devosia sp.]